METSASFEARYAPFSYPTNWFTEGFDTPAQQMPSLAWGAYILLAL
jgi:hypothetical protein